MDNSISMDEGDSLFSPPGHSNRRVLFHTPPQPTTTHTHSVGLGVNPSLAPHRIPQMDDSLEAPNRWGDTVAGASPAVEEASFEYGEEEDGGESQEQEHEQEHDGQVDDEGEEDEGEGYPESEGSSAQYDPDADPEAFAERLDELAGVLEIGEEEARALRWGPAIGRERDAPALPLTDFKNLVNHHLTSTEWRFSPPNLFLPSVPGRMGAPILPGDIYDAGDAHPIRVLGRGWVEADDEMDDDSDTGLSPPRARRLLVGR